MNIISKIIHMLHALKKLHDIYNCNTIANILTSVYKQTYMKACIFIPCTLTVVLSLTSAESSTYTVTINSNTTLIVTTIHATTEGTKH